MNMRRLPALAVITVLAAPFTALAVSAGKDLPAPTGEALHRYITRTNPYEKWSMWPGKQAFYPGTRPHGALLTTYIDEPALQAIKKNASLPDGSIIVKENYTPAKKLKSVTVMYKSAGFNPQAGDFFWLKYAPDGKIQAEGKVESCIGCHRLAQGNDFLYTNDPGKK